MASNNSYVNPQAKEAMHRFKMETAREVGVNLKEGYNGDITARQAGSIGGHRADRTALGHEVEVRYIALLTI